MPRPNLLSLALVTLALALTACGDDKTPSSSDLDRDGSAGERDGGGPLPPDGGGDDRDGAGPLDPNDAEAPDARVCRTACEPGDCGRVPDGCGDFLSCSGCPSGLVCGQYALNKCGVPPPDECMPQPAAVVCPGKCGAVSDGCSGVVQCSADNGGEVCEEGETCRDMRCEPLPAACVPDTCQTLGHGCGQHGDGCGGIIACGTCDTGERCEYALRNSACAPLPADVPTCTPRTAAQACADGCGVVGDGCGATIDCEQTEFACAAGETCGGGGVPGECGSSGQSCVPIEPTVACAGKCGSQSNGCGGLYHCDEANGGETCDAAARETCGGGGVPNVCGQVPCTARTVAEACPASGVEKSCGQQPDGCGGMIDCGGCAQNQQCGLFTASLCGTIPSCEPTPASVACAGKCGVVPDGCGGSYTCSSTNGGVTCTGNEYCGANNTPNRCGAPPVTCTPRTCEQLGHSCGLASDGCGRVLNCWGGCAPSDPSCTGSCGANAACVSNETQAQTCVSGGPTCTGTLCSTIPTSCTAAAPTRLTGTVRTPGVVVSGTTYNQLPVPNALVYIPAEPTAALPAIFQGVDPTNAASCGRCDDEKLVADGQSVLAAAVTDHRGNFTLEGRVPVGSAFRLVVKVGKWRRVVEVPAGVSAACASRSLPLQYTRLPANSQDGLAGTQLPKVAISTGDVDAMECVLRGMGISDGEFTRSNGAGRVHMYRANGAMMCSGTWASGGVTRQCTDNNNQGCRENRNGCSRSQSDTELYASATALNAYDMVVFDCEGTGHYVRGAAPRTRLLDYTNAGGRVFASHWSYEWLDGNGSLEQASAWTDTGASTSATGYISLPSGSTARTRANPVKSLLFRDWLDWQGALSGTTAGQLNNPATPRMSIIDPRDVAGANVGPTTDEWMYRNSNGPKVQQLSFTLPTVRRRVRSADVWRSARSTSRPAPREARSTRAACTSPRTAGAAS